MDKNLSVKLTIDAKGNVKGVAGESVRELKKIDSQVDLTSKTLGSIKNVAVAAFAGWGVSNVIGEVIDATKEMQSLQASLVTVKGSAIEAEKSFAQIQKFAQETPYQLTEVTDAFIKMEAMGLNASEESMRSYGDTASSMGKSLNQMIEAVADAATGEFERLKEFGIKSSSEGDRVKFTFKGVTTEVGKNAAEIESYLMRLGTTNFSGGMARQMETVGGQLSNLEGSWQRAYNAFGEASQPAIKLAIDGLSDLAGTLEDSAKYIDDVAYIAGIGLTTALTAKAIPAIWSTSTAFNAAMVSAGGFAAATRGATLAALAFAATPLGLAVTAMAGGVAYLALREDEAETATRDLNAALKEQNAELSKGELKKRAERLVKLRQELEALVELKKQNKAIDILGVKERKLQQSIDAILNFKSSIEKTTESLVDLNKEVNDLIGLNLQEEVNSAASEATLFADMLATIAQLNNEFNSESLKERTGLQSKINELTLDESQKRQLILDNLYPENKALQQKVWHLQDAAKAQETLNKLMDDGLNEAIQQQEAMESAWGERANDSYNNQIASKFEKDKLLAQALEMANAVDTYGDAWTRTGDKALDAMGSMMSLMSEVNANDQVYAEEMARLRDKELEQTDEFMKLEEARAKNSVRGSMDMLAASVAMFEEGSKAQKAAHTIYQTVAAVELGLELQKQIALMATGTTAVAASTAAATAKTGEAMANATASVTAAGSGDPYTAPFRVVAMTAMMAATLANIGQSFSGGGSSGTSGMQGTAQAGGRLGQADTDTYSLESSYDRMLELEADQYHELKGINSGVKSLNQGIVNAVTGMYTTGFAESVNAGLYSNYGGLGQNVANGFNIPGVNIVTGFANSIVDKIFGSGTVAKISNSVFGGKTTVSDPRLEFAGTVLDPDFWAEQTKKVDGGWFRSSKKSTIGIDLNARLIEQFNQIFDSVGDTADAIGEQLGLTEQQISAAVSGVDLAKTLGEISLKGEAEDITKRLGEAFSKVADAVGYELAPDLINRFAQLGETYFDTLTRVVTDKVIIEDVFKISGQSLGAVFEDVAIDIYEVSQSLVKLAGGVSELREAASNYFSKFFTEEEQFEKLTQDLHDQFSTINSILPETRDGYRALVEAQNLGIESDRERYVTLMELSDMADDYYRGLADSADNYYRGLADSALSALGELDRSISAERKSLSIARNQRVDALKAEASAINDSVAALGSLKSALASSLGQIEGTGGLDPLSYAQAQSQLMDALSSAQAGNLPALRDVESALSIVSNNNESIYSSFADFEFDQKYTGNLIDGLIEVTDDQLSIEEQALKNLENQVSAADRAYEQQIYALESEMQFWEDQLNALNGIDNSVLSLADAIAQIKGITGMMSKEQVAAQADETSIEQSAEAIANRTTDAIVRDAYESVLGLSGDFNNHNARVNYWVNMLDSGKVSKNGFIDTFTESAASATTAATTLTQADIDYNRKKLGIPSFASGGLHSGGIRLVGENGPELEFTGPSRILNNAQTKSMLNNAGVERLLSQLIKKTEALEAQLARTAVNTEKSSDSLVSLTRGTPTYNMESV